MQEIDVIANLIRSDLMDDVEKVDGLIGNRSIESTKEHLSDKGISDELIEDIEFFSHMHSDSSVDILGTVENWQRLGIEAKGVAPSKEKSRSNLKYWAKGIFNQTAEIHDTTNCDTVGFAIPKDVADVFRGVISSYDKKPTWEDVENKDPEDLYGERQVEVMESFEDDLVILVSNNTVETYSVSEFFGLN